MVLNVVKINHIFHFRCNALETLHEDCCFRVTEILIPDQPAVYIINWIRLNIVRKVPSLVSQLKATW